MSNLSPQQFGDDDRYWSKMSGFDDMPLPPKKTGPHRPLRTDMPAPKPDTSPKQGIKPMQGPETYEMHKYRRSAALDYELRGDDW